LGPAGLRQFGDREQIHLERKRAFGAVWHGWTLWRALALDTLCDKLLLAGRESVPWPVTAAVLLDRLGLRLPVRLKTPPGVGQM
jgi:hypothetical protein